MITLIQCVRRRPELSIAEFREQWRAYAATAKTLAEATGAVGLVVNTTLAVDQNLDLQLARGTAEPYDGVLKFSWPNAATLGQALAEPRVAAVVAGFRAHQERFVDLEHSRFFFASEETLHGGTP